MRPPVLSSLFALVVLGGIAGPAPAAPQTESPAEKLRQALDQHKDLEIVNQGLSRAAEMLSQQTGVPFVTDPVAQSPSPEMDFPVLTIRASNVRLASALSAALAPHGIAHVILGDRVLLTSSDRASHLAVRQQVNVSLKGETLADALDRLAKETAVNVVLDPQA